MIIESWRRLKSDPFDELRDELTLLPWLANQLPHTVPPKACQRICECHSISRETSVKVPAIPVQSAFPVSGALSVGVPYK